MGVLEEKYPEVLAIAMFAPENSSEVERDVVDLSSVPSECSVLYHYGLAINQELEAWAKKNPRCDLVFIEEDPSVVQELVAEKQDDLFALPNVHLRLYFPTSSFEEFIEAVSFEFPFEHVFVYEGVKEGLREQLLRKSVMANAVHNEMLFYPKLYRNLKENFQELGQGFDMTKWKDRFKDVPAIICGAGPSLASVKNELNSMRHKALFFAGGSSIVALGALNLEPDLCFAFDPNYEEYVRLRHNFALTAPMITGTRVHPDISRSFVGPRGYFATGTGGFYEEWMEKQLGITDEKVLQKLNSEALSVTTIEVASAIYMGCNPIILAGVDLCYKGNVRYSQGVLPKQQTELEASTKASDQIIQKDGTCYVTKWLMEKDVIDALAKDHPTTTIVDGTCQGVTFDHIEKKPLCEMLDLPFVDTDTLVHEAVETSRFAFETGSMEKSHSEMQSSLERSWSLIQEICDEMRTFQQEETPKMIALEYDLEEELAFQLLLKSSQQAYALHLKKELIATQKENIAFQIKYKLYKQLGALVEEMAGL